MFMEIGNDVDEEFRQIEQIRTKGLAREIFLTSSRKDPDLLLKAMKTGVKEFFPQPVNHQDIIASLVKARGNREAEARKKKSEKKGTLISVIGSKGGVGVTTTAVNIAVSLREAASDKAIALIDMNPLMGDVSLFLDIKNNFSWADAAKDIERMDTTYLVNALHKHSSGIHVLPAPSKPVGLEAATAETLTVLVGLMKSAFDITVIDGCKYCDELSLRMLALSDTILVVSELNLPSIVNAKKLLETFEGLGLSFGKDIKIVINRYQKTNMISPEEAEKTLGKNISCMIPNDYETTMTAINNGTTLGDSSLKPAVMTSFRDLAALLLKREAVIKKDNWTFSLFKKNFKDLALRLHKQDAR
jgi:pilus assembly protein CpaE